VIGVQFEKALAWQRRAKWRRKNGSHWKARSRQGMAAEA
jgi:hypothetical protein